jgi:hypothetical protein
MIDFPCIHQLKVLVVGHFFDMSNDDKFLGRLKLQYRQRAKQEYQRNLREVIVCSISFLSSSLISRNRCITMNLGNVDFYKSTYQFLEICAYMDNSSQ